MIKLLTTNCIFITENTNHKMETDVLPESAKAVLYICKFNYATCSIGIETALIFKHSFMALDAYANIPNPESQLITGETYVELCERLKKLHDNIKSPTWLEMLRECL